MAIRGLQGHYELLRDNWKTKVNPLDPSVNDQNIRNKALVNPILKELAKEEKGTTQALLNPAE